jgi:hypothetical protein
MRRTLISIALLLSAAQAAPAFAAGDERCTTLPATIRAAAATAEPDAARRALRRVSLGEQLCEARNKSDAAEQFRAAARDLGIDLAQAKAAAAGKLASSQ